MLCSVRLWHNALEEQRGCYKIHYLKFLFLFRTRFHAALFLSSCSFFSSLLFWGFCVWQFFSTVGFVLFVTLFLPLWAPPSPGYCVLWASFSFSVVQSFALLFFLFRLIVSYNTEKQILLLSACFYMVLCSRHFPFRIGALHCMDYSFWFQESQTHVRRSANANGKKKKLKKQLVK